MAAANRDFTRKHPLAIKRALRAMLKATDLCARQPERAARRMVERGVADQYEYVLQSVKEIGFQWREYESEDTGAVLGLASPGGGHHQVEPQQDHRAGDRLALFQ